MPSRSKKSRDAAPGSARPSDADAQAAFGRPGGPPVTVLQGPVADPRRPGRAGQETAARPGRRAAGGGRSRGRLLRNWRVRSRLVLLIAIPTATAVALGAFEHRLVLAERGRLPAVAQLASLSSKVTTLAYEIEYERDNTVWFIAMKTGPTGSRSRTSASGDQDQLQVVHQQYVYTNQSDRPGAGRRAAAIGSDFPPGVVLDAHSVLSELELHQERAQCGAVCEASAADVINRYSAVINVLLAFEDQIALSSNDPQLTSTVSALSQISRIQEEFSIQRGIDGVLADRQQVRAEHVPDAERVGREPETPTAPSSRTSRRTSRTTSTR